MLTQSTDYLANAAAVEACRKRINAHFRLNPGGQMAHDARCAAALVIHLGGSIDHAMAAALPGVDAA